MTPDRPIINSLLDVDFYKLPMIQMIFHKQRMAKVGFSFINRTRQVPLAAVVDMGRLREELEHCMSLRFTPQELHYIMGTYEYEQPMFKLDFIEFLKKHKLPPFFLVKKIKGTQLDLLFEGNWAEYSLWETLSMSIVNELYYRELMKGFTRVERERVEAEGRIRLAEKIRLLKQNREITFSDFGTRRRFSRDWQDHVVSALVEEFPLDSDDNPGQFLGTSNVLLAMKYGVKPTGTNAHELPMAYSGIYEAEDRLDPAFSQKQVLTDWESEYGKGLLMFLPDTFGSDWFFKNAVTYAQLLSWKGSRQDSGEPLEYAEKRIREYKNNAIDPSNKLLVFADALNVRKMVHINSALRGRILNSFGWGTDLTNDLGFPSISIVCKVVHANGVEVAKLSDNIEKATGSPGAIERMKKVVGYTTTFSDVCKS